MNKKFRLLSLLLPYAVLAMADCQEECSPCPAPCDNYSKGLWQPRSFNSYKTREVNALKHNCGGNADECWSKYKSVSFEYMQSFGDSQARLGALPFWSGTNTMTIGSNDGNSDLDAYQFGLGDVAEGSQGSITLCPRIKHVGADMLLEMKQNPKERGMYVKVKAPLGAMVVNASLSEDLVELQHNQIKSQESNPIAEANAPIWLNYTAVSQRHESISDALYGGHRHRELDFRYGRFASCCNKSVVRLGDLEVAAGYDAWVAEKGSFGLGFKMSAPTGNVPQADFALEPIFGRAGHWAVGGEMNFNYKVWESDCADVRLYVAGEALHLFSGRKPSWRSFDLKANGKGSRYMMLGAFGFEDRLNNVELISFQHIIPAINVTTLPVISKFAVEGSAVIMLDAKRDDWNMSLAGEFWGRSCEKLAIDYCNTLQHSGHQDHTMHLNNYAVLGRQTGFGDALSTNLCYCEPLATINKSQNTYFGVFADKPAGIENAAIATNRISSDFEEALDLTGAAAVRSFSGKVTAEVGYTWSEKCHMPHLSLFGGVEFFDKKSKMVNLWSVGLQGSLQF